MLIRPLKPWTNIPPGMCPSGVVTPCACLDEVWRNVHAERWEGMQKSVAFVRLQCCCLYKGKSHINCCAHHFPQGKAVLGVRKIPLLCTKCINLRDSGKENKPIYKSVNNKSE